MTEFFFSQKPRLYMKLKALEDFSRHCRTRAHQVQSDWAFRESLLADWLTFCFMEMECWGFCSVVSLKCTLCDQFKKIAPLSHPIKSKKTPNRDILYLHTFSRASCKLQVFASSFDWFTGLSMVFVISDYSRTQKDGDWYMYL